MKPYHLLNPKLSDEEFRKGIEEHRAWMRKMSMSVVIAASIGGAILLICMVVVATRG